MSALYSDGDYYANNPTWHIEDSSWKAKNIAALIAKNGLAPRTVVEIGCGAGQVLNGLSTAVPGIESLQGYDISPQAIELCQSIQNPRLAFHNKDFLAEDAVYFDAVLAIDVFEHVEDYFSFLRSLRTKGKYKIFHIPLEIIALSALRGLEARNRKSVGHIHLFSRETALMALEETGYKVIDAVYTSGALDLPQKSFKQALAFLPRKLLAAIHMGLAVRLLGGWSLLVLAE